MLFLCTTASVAQDEPVDLDNTMQSLVAISETPDHMPKEPPAQVMSELANAISNEGADISVRAAKAVVLDFDKANELTRQRILITLIKKGHVDEGIARSLAAQVEDTNLPVRTRGSAMNLLMAHLTQSAPTVIEPLVVKYRVAGPMEIRGWALWYGYKLGEEQLDKTIEFCRTEKDLRLVSRALVGVRLSKSEKAFNFLCVFSQELANRPLEEQETLDPQVLEDIVSLGGPRSAPYVVGLLQRTTFDKIKKDCVAILRYYYPDAPEWMKKAQEESFWKEASAEEKAGVLKYWQERVPQPTAPEVLPQTKTDETVPSKSKYE